MSFTSKCRRTLLCCWLSVISVRSLQADPVAVNAVNFARAETDMYFARAVKAAGGLGKFYHVRTPTPIDKQDVVRMNRDTLYSAAVFDLDAVPVTITLPDSAQRFMSLSIVKRDHYAMQTLYAPQTATLDRESIGTRYVMAMVRTFVNANDPEDIKTANAAQDDIELGQASTGVFDVPQWDLVTHKTAREALIALAALGGTRDNRFGRPEEVDTVSWFIGTAAGWGGNPLRDAMYVPIYPTMNDGKTAYQLTIKDVPVVSFWSISVYNADGFFFENDKHAYSVNNVTAKRRDDRAVQIQFGGDPTKADNALPITRGWNYVLRLYRPRN